MILHGAILRTRPARSARLYRKVWTEEGAPLLAIARRQRDGLVPLLRARLGRAIPVALGMRYGQPSIASALRELRAQGVDQLVVLPLCPQNSCSTTGSTFDALGRELERWRFVPELRFIDNYHDHPGYIEALAASVREAWATQSPAERLVFSFHGTPERFRTEGDVYFEQCRTTARQVAERLALTEERWVGVDALKSLGTNELAMILLDVVRDGERAKVAHPGLLAALGLDPAPCKVGRIWRHLADQLLPGADGLDAPVATALETILKHGPLSRRMLAAAGARPTREQLHELYLRLAACLVPGEAPVFVP